MHVTTGFNDNNGSKAAKKQGFWGKAQQDESETSSDVPVEDELDTAADGVMTSDPDDLEATKDIPLVFVDEAQPTVQSNANVVDVRDESNFAEASDLQDAPVYAEDAYPADGYVDADYDVEETSEELVGDVATSPEPHNAEGAYVPELSWDDEEPKADQTFFGGTPSAYSDYIEDSPAYEPVSNIYDQAEAAESDSFDRKNVIQIVIAVVSVLIALVIVFVLGVQRFSNRYLPNTLINGFDVSGLTVEEAQGALEQQTADYACTVTVGDFSTTVHGSDIGIERDEERMASEPIKGQSPYFWPVALIIRNPVEVDAGIKFDENKAAEMVVGAVEEKNEQSLPSDNASIEYDEASGLYRVAGTTEGTALDPKAISNSAVSGIRMFQTEVSPSAEETTHEATVTDIPSYAHTAENANRDRSTDISITVDGETAIVSEAAQNAAWITVSSGPKISVDEEAVRFWAQAYVADAVYHDDDWSYYALDEDAFVSEFCKRLAEGVTEPFEAPTVDELKTEGESRERAYQKGGWNSELGRYIDVDLESQFARLFDEKGEVIWESAFVSGSMYEGRSTVTGQFEIYSMQTNTVLVGMDYNGDGYPDYESFVNYWMPFYGGYGLHDATWRSSFGGENYYYGGSHGCVNLPYSKAAELYSITHVGEMVNVHW